MILSKFAGGPGGLDPVLLAAVGILPLGGAVAVLELVDVVWLLFVVAAVAVLVPEDVVLDGPVK
jgi:hypothetical protein